MAKKVPDILLVLPMFLQDGIDKYNGIMRSLNERQLKWNIRFDRLAPNWDRPTAADLPEFDGIIADGLALVESKESYLASRIPLVALDWFSRNGAICRKRLVHIDSDSAEIGRCAAKALLGVGGFASYAFLPQPDKPSWSTDRGAAFVSEMSNNDFEPVVIDALKPLEDQLRALPKPAAVFAAHDTIAAQAIRAAGRINIAIPEDLSILGVDNERLTCLHTDPPLATIQPDFETAGYLAATALADMMDGKSPQKHQRYHVKDVIMRKSLEPAGTAGRLVQRAMAIIRDHATEQRSIDAIADALGVSRRLLDRRFRQITGQSVLDVIQRQRLQKICTLLTTTNLPISEICASCSFGSGTYPLRLFRSKIGMSMHDYRKSHRGGSQTGRQGVTPSCLGYSESSFCSTTEKATPSQWTTSTST